MNREDIIRMAREQGLPETETEGVFRVNTDDLGRMLAAEREKVAAWMMRQGYATGHGDTVEDLLQELDWQVREQEREACAKVCDEKVNAEYATGKVDHHEMAWTQACAIAIRARGQA
jgi:F0F1-type ATP synthase alpha subunit